MARTRIVTDYHIRAYTSTENWCGNTFGKMRTIEEIKQDCEKMAKRLEREFKHELEGIRVVEESHAVCEFCGTPWEADNELFNGGCCDRDLHLPPGYDSDDRPFCRYCGAGIPPIEGEGTCDKCQPTKK
jgi:hypothetical protein